jgi:hypothetical protein
MIDPSKRGISGHVVRIQAEKPESGSPTLTWINEREKDASPWRCLHQVDLAELAAHDAAIMASEPGLVQCRKILMSAGLRISG